MAQYNISYHSISSISHFHSILFCIPDPLHHSIRFYHILSYSIMFYHILSYSMIFYHSMSTKSTTNDCKPCFLTSIDHSARHIPFLKHLAQQGLISESHGRSLATEQEEFKNHPDIGICNLDNNIYIYIYMYLYL